MSDKIKTIAELKKRVEVVNSEMGDGCYREDVLNLIDEFEASVKERIEYLKENQHDIGDWWELEILRRLLGEG